MTYRPRMDDRWAIVVPGSGRIDAEGSYRIGPRARACVRAAARLARRRRPEVVVLTGWSPVGGATEAHQMLEVWDGPDDVEVVLEPSATITAENMSRSLPHLLARNVRETTIVWDRRQELGDARICWSRLRIGHAPRYPGTRVRSAAIPS